MTSIMPADNTLADGHHLATRVRVASMSRLRTTIIHGFVFVSAVSTKDTGIWRAICSTHLISQMCMTQF